MVNQYGYKVCYQILGNSKIKIYAVTNTYGLAVWHVRWYQREPPEDKKTKLPILNVKMAGYPYQNL